MAALLCVALCFVPLLGSRRQSVQLPSGEVVTLLGVAKGKTPFLFPHSRVSRFLSSLHLTNGIGLGPLYYPSIRSVNESLGVYRPSQPLLSNSLQLVLRHEGPIPRVLRYIGPTNEPQNKILVPWHFLAKATLADESSDEWESGLSYNVMPVSSPFSGPLVLWGFNCFPRRGSELRFRIYTNSPEQGWTSVVEFKLPNPYRGDYPRWQASPLPAVARTNQFEASLISISRGLSADVAPQHQWSSGVADKLPQVWSTEFKLRLLEKGIPSNQWRPHSLHVVDATSNEWTAKLKTDYEAGGVWQVSVYNRVFSPNEVWRMSFTFVRKSSSDPLGRAGIDRAGDDSRTVAFLVQPPSNPPSFKTPFPASSK